jgi:hypothetical protein
MKKTFFPFLCMSLLTAIAAAICNFQSSNEMKKTTQSNKRKTLHRKEVVDDSSRTTDLTLKFLASPPYNFHVSKEKFLNVEIEPLPEKELEKFKVNWFVGSDTTKIEKEMKQEVIYLPSVKFKPNEMVLEFPDRPVPSPVLEYRGVVTFNGEVIPGTEFKVTRERVEMTKLVYHGGPYISYSSLGTDFTWWWGCVTISEAPVLDHNQKYCLERAIKSWAKENKKPEPAPFDKVTTVDGKTQVQIKISLQIIETPWRLVVNDYIELFPHHFVGVAEISDKQANGLANLFKQGDKKFVGPLMQKPDSGVSGEVGFNMSDAKRALLQGCSFGFITYNNKRVDMDQIIVNLEKSKRETIIKNFLASDADENLRQCLLKQDVVILCQVELCFSELQVGFIQQ